jgi:hypothetical protein
MCGIQQIAISWTNGYEHQIENISMWSKLHIETITEIEHYMRHHIKLGTTGSTVACLNYSYIS